MDLPELPVTAILPRLLEALAEKSNAVVVAPPGAGKTTLVPLALLDAPWRLGGRIVMLEPRRIAARAAAMRMASLIGETAGQRIGYRTRLDSAVSAQTIVEVVTEGLLVRRLQSDPGLDGVAAVILDEIHERTLDSDLALAFCLDLQRSFRPELRLVAMSATADAQRLSGLLDAPVIESAGRMFPVEIRHAARDLTQPRDLPEAASRAVRGALAEHAGDILVFLPGMGEIRRAQESLAGCGALVLPLHGDLPPAEQDRALRVFDQDRASRVFDQDRASRVFDQDRASRSGDGRRVVLATSIAETSLTVPGMRVVIDGGWRRAPRLDPASGLTRLTTLRISRAAAEQRAGRAGREAPGVAIRLWTEALHRGLPLQDRPEMLEAELSGLALDCASWGADPASLPFPDAPPAGALAAAQALLRELGFLGEDSRLTDMGRRAARLGAHPRLSAMMLAAETPGQAALAAAIAALLEERDPLRGADAPAEIGLRLAALEGDAAGADRGALSRIRRGAAQYRSRLRIGAAEPSGDPAPLIAAGFPDRIAQQRGEAGSFRLAGGGGARLARNDSLANAKLLAVAALEMHTTARIRMAARLDADALPAALAARVTETVESGFDAVSGTVFSRRRRRLGALVLEDRVVAADPMETARVLAAAAAGRGALPWSEAARQFQARVALLRALEPETWPDLDDAILAETAAEWLAPHILGVTRLADLARVDLLAILRGMLEWKLASRLERDLPTHLDLAHGRAAVDYTQPVPVASARAQAFYGLAETPRLAGGRAPLQLALLSPAGRPIAITADLAGFWAGAWGDARKDMRGRYPKHDWPEHPGRRS